MADDPRRQQGEEAAPEAHISFFVKNEAAGQAMARRTVVDRNNEEHEAVTMSWSWRDTWQEEHKRAFVVAKMAKADLLAEVHDSLQKALDEGQSFGQWKKEIVPKLEGRWLGRTVGELWDELSEKEKARRTEPSEKQREKVIAPERLELIFRTNMAVANAAGHYSQLMKTRSIYPYWRYVTRADGRVRDSHRVLHNMVYRWDDPFWDTFFPPNGFRCRCHVSPMTKRQVERDPKLHIGESNITEDADGRKVLDIGGGYYRNNLGWDYNPGAGVDHLVELAKDRTKGRPAQVQADLEADLDQREAEEGAAAAKAKAKAEKRRRAAKAMKARLKAESEAEEAKRKAEEAMVKVEAERLDGQIAEKTRQKTEHQAKDDSKNRNIIIPALDNSGHLSTDQRSIYQRPAREMLNPNSEEYKKRFAEALSKHQDGNCDEETKQQCLSILRRLVAYGDIPDNYKTSEPHKNEQGDYMLIFRGGNYSIESAQKALENYVYEHAILFDRNDNFYIEISSGDLFEVSFPSKENYRGFTFLHNHPNGTFTSGDDIDLAFRYRLKELQTISLGHIYSLLTSGSFINKPTSPNAAECFTEYWAACYGIDNFDQLSPQQQHDILLPYIAKSRYIHLLK